MIDKKLIIEKSAILFKTYGIRCTTMDDIARELGVSKKTVYQYIADKDELLNEVIEQEYTKIKAVLEKIKLQASDSIEELIRINTLIVHFLKVINPTSINDLKKGYPLVYTDAQMRFRDMFSQTIILGIKQGKLANIFRADVNEDLIARLHTERIDQMQETSGFWGANSSSPEVIKEMITYYLRGLVTEQGDALLTKYLLEYNKFLII